jgi:hypothetical protein
MHLAHQSVQIASVVTTSAFSQFQTVVLTLNCQGIAVDETAGASRSEAAAGYCATQSIDLIAAVKPPALLVTRRRSVRFTMALALTDHSRHYPEKSYRSTQSG